MTQPATKDAGWLATWLLVFIALAAVTWMSEIAAAPVRLYRRILDRMVNGRNLSFEEIAWTDELESANAELGDEEGVSAA